MHGRILTLVLVLLASGCGQARQSSLLLERQAMGPLQEEASVAMSVDWHLEPVLRSKAMEGIDVQLRYASSTYLSEFFANREIFGAFAGSNPYYPEHLVFYVKVTNNRDKRILVNPDAFVLVDDHGNQFGTIGMDYVNALAESRAPLRTITRGVLRDARPGFYGLSLPVGQVLAPTNQGHFAQMKLSSLQKGYLYPGVVHDGLIVFWSPAINAKRLRLFTDFKSDFNANDEAQAEIDIVFEFDVLE